jgi:hypothetical protein
VENGDEIRDIAQGVHRKEEDADRGEEIHGCQVVRLSGCQVSTKLFIINFIVIIFFRRLLNFSLAVRISSIYQMPA